MDMVMNTSYMELSLLPKRQGLVSDSIDLNMEETENHTRHNGINSSHIPDCDTVNNRKNASIHVEPTIDSKDQRSLDCVRNGFSSIGWGMEIITMATSFLCMGLLVLILALFQNRPLADWSFWISLNAVVAIAATAAKATLLAAISACLSQEKWQHFSHRSHCLQDMAIIDHASRGPLGSMQMLLKVSWGFASVGAVITVLSLTTDAFVQQITKYESDTIYTLHEGSAIFRYTYGYSSNSVAISEDISNHVITYKGWTVDTLMQDAVLKAVFDQRLFFPINWACDSDCLWDQDYTTLGFSSTCIDVTKQTLATMDCLNATKDGIIDNCSLISPGGIQFDTSAYTSAKNNRDTNNFAIAVGSSDLKYGEGPVINGSDLFRAAVWIWNNFEGGPNNLVVECSLGVAIYKYSNISATQYNVTIGATEKRPLGNNSGSTIDSYNDRSPDNLLWWNDTGSDQPDIYISLLDLAVLADFFQSPSFSGSHSSVTWSGNYHPGAAVIFERCTNSEGDAVDGNVVKSCISDIFDGITTSMAASGLQMQDNIEFAQGLTSQIVVYIRVRWAWLVLPLVVQFLGGIALVVTIAGRKRTKNVPLWKASTLAILYHSVDEHGALVAHVKDPKQLEEISKRLEVVLDQ